MRLGPPMFFLRNSLSDQWLLIKALVLVCCVRLALWLMPLRVLRRMAKISSSVSSPARPQLHSHVVRKIASSVRRASRYVPAASCLTQALATQVLLARRGQVTNLRIGVTNGDEGGFKAHAWLESNGEIIIGRVRGLRSFTVLHPLEKVTQ